jgi:NodT family efflux transporter outer membrane factor (OMF) lipoprotein
MKLRPLAAASLLLCGCAVGPDYERPALSAPAAWSAGESGKADLVRWWTSFRDPLLDSLVERALATNLDLRAAGARIRESRALAEEASGVLLPALDAQGSAARTESSRNSFFGSGPFPVARNEFGLSLVASWEIDLFGGARRGQEAYGADLEAAVEDQRAALVSLLGEVALAYVSLRGAQREATVLRDNAASARTTLDLTRSRVAAGIGTALDTARAEAQSAASAAQLPTAEAAVRRWAHRLAVLLGREPGALLAELGPEAAIPSAPERLLVGVPSDLLSRRPDLRRAERRLAAATARVGLAVAELYPRISLTGAFGLDSLSAGNLFSWDSRTWTLGPSIRWPVFAGGRILARVRAQEARTEQALLAYEAAFLLALEEVENALVAHFRERERRRSLEESALAARQAVDLADALHRAGLASFLEVLEAQRSLHAAQAELARSEAAVTLHLVALYKALGGGWESEGPP